MTAGNRKNPQRPSAWNEYQDNQQRQQKHLQNRHVWAFILSACLLFWTLVVIGVKLSFF